MTAVTFVKLIGVCCTLLCGYLAGNEKVVKLKHKRLLYSDILRLLDLLEQNFRYENNPLPRFVETLGPQNDFYLLSLPCDLKNKDFSQLRKAIIFDWPQKNMLDTQSAQGWALLWGPMGSGSSDEEIRRLDWYRVIIQKGQKQAEEKEREAIRLYRSVGLTAAAVLAVLLL